MDSLLKKLPEDIQKKYINETPIPVVAVAKDLGIDIFETPDFAHHESGSIKKEGNTFVIYLNTNDSIERKRFTIAHEIGHFLLHKNYLDKGKELVDESKQPTPGVVLKRAINDDMDLEKRKMEVQANRFAAELLMPEEMFKKVWNESIVIEEIAEAFNVSPSAVTVRAKELFNSFMT